MAITTIAQLGANLKANYAPKVINLVPSQALLQQYRSPNAPGADPNGALTGAAVAVPIDWTEAEKMGKYWVVPTKYQSGQGVSYLGPNGALSDLQEALQTQIAEVQVQGYELNVRQQVAYKALSTADGAANKSVESAAKIVMDDMRDVAYNRQEISALYGQSNIGVVASQTLVSTTLTVVFTAASFSPGIWVSNIGARCAFFTGTTFKPAGQSASAYATVTSVDTANRTVVFTTAGSGWTNLTVPAANDVCCFLGAQSDGGTFNEMVGLDTQITATTGTLFNVNRANVALFQGQTFSVGNVPLTKAAVIKAAMKCVDKGNMSDMVLLVGTASWADLAAEDLALRMFDGSFSGRSSESGSESLVYNNVNGKIKVVCHPFMKAGEAFLFTPGHVSWVGSSDVRFLGLGLDSKQLWRPVPDKNALEMQVYADKQIYHAAPSQAIKLTGIVASS
jgi:hypothetical protein